MRYAVLADVHADLPALTSVLEHARSEGCEAVVCAGDLLECRVSSRDTDAFEFVRVDDVFEPEPALVELLDGAVLVRGNQEERVSALVPDDQVPDWVRPILGAPLVHDTAFARHVHGHTLEMRELGAGVWSAADHADFEQPVLVHGHHHRSALHERSREDGRVRTMLDVPFGSPIELDVARHQHVVNVGPVRGSSPHWLLVDDDASTITFQRSRPGAP